MKYLYRYQLSEHADEAEGEDIIKYSVFTPSMRGGYLLPGESRNWKTMFVRFMFQMTTGGKAKIFYVQDHGELVHTSYVVPQCFKFAFMNRNDYEIGPCFTYPSYRGRGIYPRVLRSICQCVGNRDTVFYMIVDEKNIASIKGIEKAGFVRCGLVKVNQLTKRYRLIKQL